MSIPQLALLSLRQGRRICNSPPDPAARQLPAGKMNQNRQESALVIPGGLTRSAGNHPCWAGPDSDMTPELNIHNMLTASANCRAYSAVAIGRGYLDRRPQGPHLINKRKGCLSRQQTGMTSATRESNGRPGVEILDGMLTNSTNGLCEAVLGEVWCPCISYSATSKTRLEILPAVAVMCICGHDYSWHGARRAGQLEYSTRSRQPVHAEPETGHPVPLIPAQGK